MSLIDRDQLLLELHDRRRLLEARRCITVTQEREQLFTLAGLLDAIKAVEAADAAETVPTPP